MPETDARVENQCIMHSPMRNRFVRRTTWIMGIRASVFLGGWWFTAHYGDWRQLAGYPLLLIGALPDALFVRYAIEPRSSGWPWAMAVSLVVSSALFAAVSLRLHRPQDL